MKRKASPRSAPYLGATSALLVSVLAACAHHGSAELRASEQRAHATREALWTARQSGNRTEIEAASDAYIAARDQLAVDRGQSTRGQRRQSGHGNKGW